jgi:hypothetical protein
MTRITGGLDVAIIREEYAALHMEVCVENGATDAEILKECNSWNWDTDRLRPTRRPWDTVIRESDHREFKPWPCDGDHTHFYVSRKQ